MKKLILLTIFAAWFLPQGVGAAISFVGVASASSSPVADSTVTISGLSLAQDDLVIVAAAIGDDDNTAFDMVNNTAGYTKMDQISSLADADDVYLSLWYKFMGASPDSNVVIEGSGTGGADSSLAVVVMVFRGVNLTTPFDVASTSATDIDSPDADPPSIDHNNPDGVWIVIAGASGHILATLQTYTFPTGYTTNSISGGQLDTNNVTVGMGYRSSGISDPEDPGVMNHSGTDATINSWAAFTMALRPAVVPSVTTDPETNVGVSSATLNGEITDTGGQNATERGFAWGTDSTFVTNTSTTTESGSFGAATFSENISGLSSGVTYYFRAFATNPIGTSFGNSDNFVTETNITPSRRMRLFEGHIIKLYGGKLRIY